MTMKLTEYWRQQREAALNGVKVRFEWKPISRGSEIPNGSILGNRTNSNGQVYGDSYTDFPLVDAASDADVYVGRNKDGEIGKLTLDKGKMCNILCHKGGGSKEGEILVACRGCPIRWVPVTKGDPLPEDTCLASSTPEDGEICPCRTKGPRWDAANQNQMRSGRWVAAAANRDLGKLNLRANEPGVSRGPQVCNLWYHGAWTAKSEGEVLVIGPEGAGSAWALAQFWKGSPPKLGQCSKSPVYCPFVDTSGTIEWIACAEGASSGAAAQGGGYWGGDAPPAPIEPSRAEVALAENWGNTSGGVRSKAFELQSDEYIVSVSGRQGQLLDAFQVHTNKGRASELWGNKSGGQPFTFEAKSGNQVSGMLRPKTCQMRPAGHCQILTGIVESSSTARLVRSVFVRSGAVTFERPQICIDCISFERPQMQDVHHFHDPEAYNVDFMCNGVRAEERVKRLVSEKGFSHDLAVKCIMKEFHNVFWWKPNADCDGLKAKDREQLLRDNKGMSLEAARVQVKNEFPAAFGDKRAAVHT